MQIVDNTRTRARRSEELTPKQRKGLMALLNKETKEQVAHLIGITRVTLDRILIIGTAKPDTIAKINAAIAAKSSKA